MALNFPYLVVAGPTASGKTALAVGLAQRFNGEIVGADARQVYRGVEVLTCAPSPEERSAVKHHLVGVLEPDAPCDVVRYVEMAVTAVREIRARGCLPIVAGGTGLYLRALTHGLDPSPPPDPELRARLGQMDAKTLRAELSERDPEALKQIDANNPRRLVRAIEKAFERASGHSSGRLWQRCLPAPAGIWLDVPREMLHARIASRTGAILAAGAIDQVAALRDMPVASGVTSAIGFRDIVALLEQRMDAPACERAIVVATRQYAKRQRTWFRARPELIRVTPDASGGWSEAVAEAGRIIDSQTATVPVPADT